eukprot:TRINITY_DN8807_c0_g1_i1.p1 TRINITY_DN8807_c0_g1~~TRINITY_DN8807_c0_g1_i1.p1  ORF type:complete len:170 (+),score=5.97 TRINITY_DN8807_c0_g1_i1:131-640(+)
MVRLSICIGVLVSLSVVLLVHSTSAQSTSPPPCAPPTFRDLTLEVQTQGDVGKYQLDMENIYCKPSQSIQGGCDAGYHDHDAVPLVPSPAPHNFTRTRNAVETGGEGTLALYCTHLSIRLPGANSGLDCGYQGPGLAKTIFNQVRSIGFGGQPMKGVGAQHFLTSEVNV